MGNARGSVLSLQMLYPTLHRAELASGPGLPISLIFRTTCWLHRRQQYLLMVFPTVTVDKDPSAGIGLISVRVYGHLFLYLPVSDRP